MRKVPLCSLHKLFRVKGAKEKFFIKSKTLCSAYYCDQNNILSVYEKCGTITFNNRLLKFFFFNFDFLINSKPNSNPLSPIAQKKFSYSEFTLNFIHMDKIQHCHF